MNPSELDIVVALFICAGAVALITTIWAAGE